ncbi:MAG: serine/threonine-protein kinase, partial [Planctomycetota bacterium]
MSFESDQRDWAEVEDAAERFEEGWTPERTATIVDWLPERKELHERGAVELVEADIEKRIKAGIKARVEDYFEYFPWLEKSGDRLLRLAKAEFRLRQRRESGLEVSEFLERFPNTAAGFFVGGAERPVMEEAGKRRFTLLEPIGEGGLGRVWLAVDHEFEREVAVKEIRGSVQDDSISRQRFDNEAKITAQLQHPGIISVYTRGQFLDGRPYYAMQLIRGSSMQEAIDSFHESTDDDQTSASEERSSRHLELRRLLSRFVDACHAVDYAHEEGVLHRDIKPANIMLGKFGEAVVVDWGLAKRVGAKEVPPEERIKPLRFSSDSTTKTGQALGSPAYMSPEQAAGKHDEVSPRSDIYSLGATLHAILFHQPPAPSDPSDEHSPQTAQFDATSFSTPRMSNSLQAICRKCLATEPGDRYGSASALAQDVERYLA